MKIIEKDDMFGENNDEDFSYDDNTENLTVEELAEEVFEEPEEISMTEDKENSEEPYETAEQEDTEDAQKKEEPDPDYKSDENQIDDIYSDSSFDPVFTLKEDEEESEEETDESEDEENTENETEDTVENDEKEYNFIVSLWKNKRRRAKLAYALVSFILVFIGVGYGFLNAILDKVESDDPNEIEGLGDEIIYDEEDFELFSAVNSAGSVNDYIDQWYESGESMHSKNVINVLLVGLDSKNGLKTGDSRSDTMMLVSLNTKTKKISMVSLFRDTWAKFVPSDGTVHFGKMNGSYRYGGINCTIQTIEKMFKIKIDHYAIVDFKNFVKLVDAVGGVDVYIQEYEAKNMKREWNIDVSFSQDENDLVHLDGTQAFWFARQRHCDSDADVSRTRRQRQVITAFINSCKSASFSQISDALNSVFSFIKTDLKKTEILGYATKALAWGWLKYPIESVKISDPSVFQTPTLFGASIVVQDYPAVAQIIQEALYGTSNIVLEDGRKIIFSLYR